MTFTWKLRGEAPGESLAGGRLGRRPRLGLRLGRRRQSRRALRAVGRRRRAVPTPGIAAALADGGLDQPVRRRRRRRASTPACAGWSSTSSRSTAGTPATPTCSARPSTASSARTRRTTGGPDRRRRLGRRAQESVSAPAARPSPRASVGPTRARRVSRSSGPPTTRNGAGTAASCSAYHHGLLVLPTSRVVVPSTGSSRPSGRGTRRASGSSGASTSTSASYSQPTARCVLQHRYRVEVGGRGERVGAAARPRAPGRPGTRAGRRRSASGRAGTSGRAGPRPPTGRPRSTTPTRPRIGRPAAPAGRRSMACTRSLVVPGSGRAAARSGAGAVAATDRLGLGRHRLGQRPHDLAQRAADRVGGVGGVVVPVEHGHHQAERLGRGEHQRRQAQTTADPVAAVRPAHGLDRDARLAQDADVAAGSPLRDAELVGEPLGGDAGAALEQLESQQRAGRRTCGRLHRSSTSSIRKHTVRNRP